MADQPGLFSGRPPLAAQMRPTSLDEVIGQDHLLHPGSPLRTLADPDSSVPGTSVMLWGPPGVGKTTLAKVIARSSGRQFMELSAVTAGVKDVREVMEQARVAGDVGEKPPVLFLDEIHRFSKAQQDALLPGVENGIVVLVAATTENPSFSVISPLLSRSLLLTLRSLDEEGIAQVVQRALESPRGFAGTVTLAEGVMEQLVRRAAGDARRALTALEAAVSVAQRRDADSPQISLDDLEEALDVALVAYDRDGDQHYDVISAFIKSVRGSDADAALHYLARMVEAGEDPRFIARRLVILAAEDIGLADPQGLVVATAAADAVAFIGMPEGRIPLAEATVYLALAPKSNAAYRGINQAISDLREGKTGAIPPHLRDAHYPGSARLGHGEGYRYSHDDPHGVSRQDYLPEPLRGTQYYRPTERGQEGDLQARYRRLRRIIDGLEPEHQQS
ncbi:MAG: putative AAA domain-containing protein [Cellulomonadaceae bacterium TMED98]|nr:MAG: putative AAA domain-containing protein [Cellulomonadaceae bacterium TMED98]